MSNILKVCECVKIIQTKQKYINGFDSLFGDNSDEMKVVNSPVLVIQDGNIQHFDMTREIGVNPFEAEEENEVRSIVSKRIVQKCYREVNRFWK